MADRTLIHGARIVSMDPAVGDLERGDLLIEGDRIAAVGADLDASGAEVIDAAGMLALPGLVDTHIHLWQSLLRGTASTLWTGEYFTHVLPRWTRYRPGDVYAGVYAGALELLYNGVTTALDFCHCIGTPDHADAAVDGLRDAGIRGLHGHSLRARPTNPYDFPHADRLANARRLRAGRLAHRDGLVGLVIALSEQETVEPETTREEVHLARDLGLRMTVHSNFPGQVRALEGDGLLGADILPVHGNVIADDELDLMAGHGCWLSTTPDVEIGMGHPFTLMGRALRRGIRPTLGVDIPSYVNPDLFTQMRLALQTQRSLDAQAERTEGREPARRPGLPLLAPRDVLSFATVDGAAALGLADEVGSLTPGKQADVLLLTTAPFGLSSGDPAAHVVMQSGVREVDTVIVAGVVRKRAGHLVGVDLPRLGRLVEDAKAHVLAGTPAVTE